MSLNKDQMREYQRRKRAEKAGKVYIPMPEGLQVEPKGLQCKPETVIVNPVCKPDVNQECLKCKPEYERGFREGYAKGFEEGKKQTYKDMPNTEKSLVGVPGETVYEPYPVKPAKQPKQSASKAAQPIVNNLLSGIVKRPTVKHHPTCKCAMCHPVPDKPLLAGNTPGKSDALLNKSIGKAFFTPQAKRP